MSYQDHFNSCPYCNKGLKSKPTIRIKSASSCEKRRKLSELGALIKGISYPSLSPMLQTKGASTIKTRPGPIEKEMKLRALGKMIRG